jgi:ankyrin repeat protein
VSDAEEEAGDVDLLASLKLLLVRPEVRARLSSSDCNGRTALHEAVSLLVSGSTSPEEASPSPLSSSSRSSSNSSTLPAHEPSCSALRLLLNAGADLGAVDCNDETALDLATRLGHQKAAEILTVCDAIEY